MYLNIRRKRGQLKILLTDNYQGDSLVVFEHKPISKEKLNIVCKTLETAITGLVVVMVTNYVGVPGLLICSMAIGLGLIFAKVLET